MAVSFLVGALQSGVRSSMTAPRAWRKDHEADDHQTNSAHRGAVECITDVSWNGRWHGRRTRWPRCDSSSTSTHSRADTSTDSGSRADADSYAGARSDADSITNTDSITDADKPRFPCSAAGDDRQSGDAGARGYSDSSADNARAASLR